MRERDYWEKHGEAFADLYEQDTWFNRVFRKGLLVRAQVTVEAIRRTPSAKVLDVGCGSGRNSILFLKEAGASQVVGVDLSENMLAMARDLAKRHGVTDQCQFVRGDFLGTNLGGVRFDYVVALGVMDYFRDPLPMLQKMRALTERYAIASFPGFAPVRTTQRKIRYAIRGQGVHWFWKSEIERMMSAAGFRSIQVERATTAGWMAFGGV